MKVDPGKQSRMAILEEKAERDIFRFLQEHGWTGAVLEREPDGEYLVIEAVRADVRRRFALIYTTATKNEVYKRLEGKVEAIVAQGSLFEVEKFAYGTSTPVITAQDLATRVFDWNEAVAPGKIADSTSQAEAKARPRSYTYVTAEAPVEQIWLLLRQLASQTLAARLLAQRYSRAPVVDLADDIVRGKAAGIAFSVRNAFDYIRAEGHQPLTRRILNLYYGAMALASAEMLASPSGPHTLNDVERMTKFGHGLFTMDAGSDQLHELVVGPIATGFFAEWMKVLGQGVDFPRSKPKDAGDLAKRPADTFTTLGELFARIPETGSIFETVLSSPPLWVSASYDSSANPRPGRASGRSYVILSDESGRLDLDTLAKLPGPLSQIRHVQEEGPGLHYQAMVAHPSHEFWHGALPLHSSPFTKSTLVIPLFGRIQEYRAVATCLLYALSIVVRYRPGIWREVEGGAQDHYLPLIETFLAVAERVLPEQFAASILGAPVYAKQPGALF